MKQKLFLTIAVIFGLIALPTAIPAHAVTTAIGNFYGGCGNFSVDLAVYGTQNDGSGDKMRFRITDGNGKTLYQEDQTVRVGVAVGSLVMNLPYQNPGVDKNPVRFAVVNLDSNGNDVGEVGFVTYNAPCQGSVGGTTRSGVFTPSGAYQGKALADSNLYQSPNAGRFDLLFSKVNQIYPVLYRSADGTWVAISVGGGEYVWIPTSTIAVDLKQLTVPPTHIFGSGIGAGQNGAGAPTAPAGFNGTASARGTLNIRSEPNGRSALLGSVPANTTFNVTGRDAYRSWVKISYNGIVGWVSAYYVNIKSADLRALPVVQ
ncbi:MAG: SH3 domain-containing protein [Chloroflexota bacterium]